MNNKKTLLIVSFHPCIFPYRSGGEERIYCFSQELSKYFDVSILSIGWANRPEIVFHQNVREVRLPNDFVLQHQNEILKYYSGYTTEPAALLALKNPNLISIILDHIEGPDFIIHEYPFSYSLISLFPKSSHIYHSQNLGFQLYKNVLFEKAENTLRLHNLLIEAETTLIDKSSLVCTCTIEEKRNLKHLFPRADIFVSPNGINRTEQTWRFDKNKGIKFLFFGSAYQPNIDAINFILRYMPKEMFHLLEFAGESAKFIPDGNWQKLGFLSDENLVELLADNRILLNPILTGSGSSMKVLKSAEIGTPIISTNLGMRGFPETCYLDFKDTLGFQKLLTEISLKKETTFEIMQEKSNVMKDFVAKNLYWKKIVADFKDTKIFSSR